MATRLGRSSATADCYYTIVESSARFSFGLVMGGHFFLRHMLVAHLPDDSLCAYLRLASISTVGVAGRISSDFPRTIQCRVGCFDCAIWFWRSLHRAAYVDLFGVDALRDYRPSLERTRLLAGIPSCADSVSALGWRLCD